MASLKLPQFDDLPALGDFPRGSAWGLFDKDGLKDRLGTLNLLTPEIVRSAANEIQVGQSVSLNWPLDGLYKPHARRAPIVHKHIDLKFLGIRAFDDEIHFNTQSSSQWDSLCHFAHQSTGLFYNGADPAAESFQDKSWPTLEAWHERGGLVGRGVLLDYKAYAEQHGITYSPFENHAITVQDLEAVARSQGTGFHQGDILIVRTGFGEKIATLDEEQQIQVLHRHHVCGVAGNEDSARWVWDHHFAAVAADNLAFEVQPALKGGHSILHQYFLSLFGLPIGELFDLKALSEKCAELHRWTFFLTSTPLNIKGLIGSPPNALAIF